VLLNSYKKHQGDSSALLYLYDDEYPSTKFPPEEMMMMRSHPFSHHSRSSTVFNWGMVIAACVLIERHHIWHPGRLPRARASSLLMIALIECTVCVVLL
jgi:hypothetical protein